MHDIKIISSNKNWMEQAAIDQLKKAAALPAIRKAVGLPDLHPGATPVGAVFLTEGVLYPHLLGSDIGCGMSLFKTTLGKRKFKLERMAKRIESLIDLRQIDISDLMADCEDTSMGTIGGGNHFAEFQSIEKIYDVEAFYEMGLDENKMLLLVHSGSRGHGKRILDHFIKEYGVEKGLLADSEEGRLYLSQHDEALEWADRNREMIAARLLKALGIATEAKKIMNHAHNFIETKQTGCGLQYLHRKGASAADKGAVVIPGSRGSLTYVVKPSADTKHSEYSLAHGAGRKWERSMCRGRLEGIYTKETIRQTGLKGKVVCNDTSLLFEEASEAYKNIDLILESLIDFGLVTVIASCKPVLTVKA